MNKRYRYRDDVVLMLGLAVGMAIKLRDWDNLDLLLNLPISEELAKDPNSTIATLRREYGSKHANI